VEQSFRENIRLYSLQDIHLSIAGYSIDVNHIGYVPPIPGRVSELHSHFDWAIHYIIHGHGTLNTDGKIYNITPGSFYITAPHVMHSWEADQKSPMDEYGMRISLHLQKSSESAELFHLLSMLKQYSVLVCPLHFTADCYLDSMLKEYESQSTGYIEMLKSLSTMLLVDTVRNVAAVTESKTVQKPNAMPSNHISLIDRHFRSFQQPQCTVDNLSGDLHISKRHLSRIMQQTIGTTHTKYKNRLRIETAKKMLTEDPRQITEIAEAVGFSSASYFSRCFRSIVGMSPQEYRELHRKNE